MYHGLGAQNVGTDPTNSMRLFHALDGLDGHIDAEASTPTWHPKRS